MIELSQHGDTFTLSGLTEEQAKRISFALLCAEDEGYLNQDQTWPITIPIDEYFYGDGTYYAGQ